jgi:hypothetical protein
MKKIFLFMAVSAFTISLNSCSSDSGEGSSLSLKLNGTTKKFKTYAEELDGHVYITGYIGNIDNPTEEVYLDLMVGATGNDAFNGFGYYNETDDYSPTTSTTNVTVNSNGKAKGTFSGTLESLGAGADITITEGTFSVSY